MNAARGRSEYVRNLLVCLLRLSYRCCLFTSHLLLIATCSATRSNQHVPNVSGPTASVPGTVTNYHFCSETKAKKLFVRPELQGHLVNRTGAQGEDGLLGIMQRRSRQPISPRIAIISCWNIVRSCNSPSRSLSRIKPHACSSVATHGLAAIS